MDINEFIEEETKDLVRVDEGQLILATQMQHKLIELATQKKAIENAEKEMKNQLEEVMKTNGITGYESNDKRVRITLAEDGIIESIDKDKLFKEYPDVYRACLKESPRKGKLQITIREEE